MTEPERADGGRAYLPATAGNASLPWYDLMSRLLGAGPSHRTLVAQADPPRGGRVLEIGCGTGNVLAAMARRRPDVELVGLDPDAGALGRARGKLGPGARLEQGFADDLPLPDGHVDRVLSSLMLHHLPADEQRGALREARRVLRPGGSIHLVDMEGEPRGLLARLAGTAMHALSRTTPGGHGHGHQGHGHGHDRPETHLHHTGADGVVALLTDAGFVDAEVVSRRRWVMGTLVSYRARVTAAG